MQRDKQKIESSLQKKGFVKKEGDHHRFYYQTLNGRITSIQTMTSHSKRYKAILDPLISQMARQCHLTKAQFIELIDCPMSQEEFETILRNNLIVE